MPEDEQGWRPPRQGGATSAAPQPGGMHTPAPVLRRRRRMRLLAWGAVLAALILLAGGLWWAIPPLRCGDLTNGVRRVDGECVGVTDGSFVFDPAFREVQEDIVAENAWAAKKAAEEDVPLVKVALLATLTPTDSSAMTHEQVLGALEGAYVALHRANHTPELRDSRPFVQLYLANEGSRQQQWEIPVNQITGMTDDDVPLVAVFGQSISTDRTEQAARRLSQAEIPVITGSTTADSLDHDNIEG
ncbi:hypothetical protein [Allosalinactinospora lopnorensis]|uniref:hypothetical protein n=1 Tax=Allosalinactinospora lopnorensis TaxID=1352348 RepID=UPI0012E0FF2A|nr:hypothetical protein [Allosalinactinospora lopnorensis]